MHGSSLPTESPPHDLLIGTDLLPSLGFQFIQKAANLNVTIDIFTNNVMLEDLKKNQPWRNHPSRTWKAHISCLSASTA